MVKTNQDNFVKCTINGESKQDFIKGIIKMLLGNIKGDVGTYKLEGYARNEKHLTWTRFCCVGTYEQIEKYLMVELKKYGTAILFDWVCLTLKGKNHRE